MAQPARNSELRRLLALVSQLLLVIGSDLRVPTLLRLPALRLHRRAEALLGRGR